MTHLSDSLSETVSRQNYKCVRKITLQRIKLAASLILLGFMNYLLRTEFVSTDKSSLSSLSIFRSRHFWNNYID